MKEYSFYLVNGLCEIKDGVTVEANTRSEGSRKAKEYFKGKHGLKKPLLDRWALFSYEGEIPYNPSINECLGA